MRSVRAVAASITSGEVTATEVMSDTLDRIAAYDRIQPQVWIRRFESEQLIGRAAEIDQRLAAGESLPLAGVPFAIKDNIDLAGLPTTAACPAFSSEPSASAAVVDRLVAAGAIPVGKTNLDQFATGLVGTRSPYGIVACAYNRDYVSGGSSSGSAVAVAAGLVPFALGTDTAGSGRVPAAFNRLFGFKPARGRWSTRGVLPACPSLDCVSVFAQTLQDVALLDSVVAGFDPADPWSREVPSFSKPVGTLRIGMLEGAALDACEPETRNLYQQTLARLSNGKVILKPVDFALLQKASELLYEGPWIAERSQSVFGTLGVARDAVHPVVRDVLSGAMRVSGEDVFAGLHALQDYRRQADSMWEEVDCLLLPTAPGPLTIDAALARPIERNARLGSYTNFVNLLDLSAVAVPASGYGAGPGFGVTLIAPAGADRALFDWVEAIGLSAHADAFDIDTRPRDEVLLAVVGAHLAGMPLHWQLETRGAKLVTRTRTVPSYRLYAMANSSPPKPALVRDDSGAAIEVEVYALDKGAFGSFVEEVPPPLAIGTVEVERLGHVKGFVAEPRATEGALDITRLGGWRHFIASKETVSRQ